MHHALWIAAFTVLAIPGPFSSAVYSTLAAAANSSVGVRLFVLHWCVSNCVDTPAILAVQLFPQVCVRTLASFLGRI